MHPSVIGGVMPTAARHRRDLSPAQRLRVAFAILATVAVVAAIGVYGGSASTQAQVLQWFSDRGISLALVGWITYALPLVMLALVLSPRTRIVARAFAWLVLPPAVVGAAVMGRPRGMTTIAWELAVSAEYVAAIQLAAYGLLAAAAICAVLTAAALTRATAPGDAVITLRRNASRTIFCAVASTLTTLVLT